MELPDGPPGAEGYQDSVTELANKKPELEGNEDINEEKPLSSTKAEQELQHLKKRNEDRNYGVCEANKAELEFQQHLNSLKIRTEDGNYRCMVERRGRDISGKWIYLCYPCAAMCSGESILQTHISGKKHKCKLSMRTVWPLNIFEEHPYVQSEKGFKKEKVEPKYEKVLQKMAQEVENYKTTLSDLDLKYDKYREVRCHIQDSLDVVKAPLIGVEYLIEHPPEEVHHEPSYMCVLCVKQGHPRTIINHLTCFWHRYNYLIRHFNKACSLVAPYRTQTKYREGVAIIVNRLAARIQEKYGRMKPVNIDKEEYERDKDQILQWIFKGHHFAERNNCTFEEVVDADLITSLDITKAKKRDPSPPVVAAPFKPNSYNHNRRNVKSRSMESLSDVSDEPDPRTSKFDRPIRRKPEEKRFVPYPDKRREKEVSQQMHHGPHNGPNKSQDKQPRPPNYEHKLKLAKDQRMSAEELSRKALSYHEKNPEKHPLYPEEWKKFWNRRYKEIQTEGKDPSKHDFKPEWIVYWTARMKELNEEELRSTIAEIYRRLRLTPPESREPDYTKKWRSPERRKSPDQRRPAERRRSPPKRRSPPPRRRSPEPRRRSPPPKRRSPDYRPIERRSPARRESPRRRSPLRLLRTRSRSPIHKARASPRKSARSPLSRRESIPRNQSPSAALQDTVLISDEELKADDLSPWNSEDSLGSLPDARSPVHRRSRTGSVTSRASRRPDIYREKMLAPQDFGAAENVVATLRLLVALEDYLGSLGPKIVDLLAEALKMEKEKANSSEDLLESDTAVVLIETAKEKLKGAVQAGLVAGGAAAAVRTAVIRAASTLHEADIRMKKKKQRQAEQKVETKESSAVPVAGVGAVDREQIAQQMAAALIAQGKTDVSSEELAQLVDAVVGMAEAKKREAESKKKIEARAANDNSTRGASGTASALQMLQSAYDDKKVEKEYVPDAMDGLSDSDLETLLKNFNELSAEEQHSLIAYLKKLEAREPARVERLRQYVSAAATTATTSAEEKSESTVDLKPVTIESDDDDYTVEDVFKSARQRVKEDQIRQEMEIVKKSIEELKEPSKVVEPVETPMSSGVQKNLFSATDLLALVQASMQSTPAPTPASTFSESDVVTSNTQPRLFGDLPEPTMMETPKSNVQNPLSSNNQMLLEQMSSRNTQNLITIGGNQNESKHTPLWEPRQISEIRGPQNNFNLGHGGSIGSQDNHPQGNYNQGPQGKYNQGPQGNHNQGSQGNYNQGPQGNHNQGSQGNYNQGPQGNHNQGSQGNYNQGLQGNHKQGPQDSYKQGQQSSFNQASQDVYNQGPWGQQSNYNQAPQDNFNQVPPGQHGNYNQGSQDSYNQGITRSQDNYAQDGRDSYDQTLRGPQDNYGQVLRPPQGNFNQGSQLMNNFNQGPRGHQDNYNQGQRGQQNNFNQGPRSQDNYSQPSSVLDNNYNKGRGQEQSFGMGRDKNNSFNQGRGNFNNRPDANQQQFGNQTNNNFRGRGRGFGGQRGRGRGYY